MIFTPANVRLIQRAVKTQTRRLVNGDQPARQKPGKSYPVQPGRGKPAVCRIRVLNVRQESLGAITFEDARREGHRTTDEFKDAWVRGNDPKWMTRQAVEPAQPTEERFDRHWADKPVHVISFELDTQHTPRFLAARPGIRRADYVTNPAQALPGEPEAVSETEQKAITENAGVTFEHWRAREADTYVQDRRLLAAEERVMLAQRKARNLGVDISRELWLLRQVQAQGRPAHMVERRLEVIERKAFAPGKRAA